MWTVKTPVTSKSSPLYSSLCREIHCEMADCRFCPKYTELGRLNSNWGKDCDVSLLDVGSSIEPKVDQNKERAGLGGEQILDHDPLE